MVDTIIITILVIGIVAYGYWGWQESKKYAKTMRKPKLVKRKRRFIRRVK